MSTAVTAKHLTWVIGGFTAVDDVSFEVETGEIFGFLGSNGAGKTSTIRMLCGITRPTSGSATVLDMDLAGNVRTIKQNIGYMSQKFSLYEDLSVIENLRFFADVYGVGKEAGERIEDALEKTGLRRRRDLITGSLPFGIKQRLALASAMLHRPRLLFLDEPTAGVDPAGRRAFWKIINDLSEDGITIFVTTHYMDEAEYCNRIALMHKGRLEAIGSPPRLKEEELDGVILEILCSNPHAALGVLKEAEIGEIAMFANSLHLNVSDEAVGRRRVRGVLNDAGITISGLERVPPSLEDVFLSVINRSENES